MLFEVGGIVALTHVAQAGTGVIPPPPPPQPIITVVGEALHSVMLTTNFCVLSSEISQSKAGGSDEFKPPTKKLDYFWVYLNF